MTYGELLGEGRRQLAAAGICDAALDARLLLAHAAGFDAARLISAESDTVGDELLRRYRELIRRRGRYEPVSRIVGERQFLGLGFRLNEATLDPRPETELLVERAIADFAHVKSPLRFADVGTGSGAIAVALLVHLQNSAAVGIDLDRRALAMAWANAMRHGVAKRFLAVQGDSLTAVSGDLDFIVTNPPYIARSDIAHLQPEVRLFDPVLALDGGDDGLDVVRSILGETSRCLKPGGRIYLEFGVGQSDIIARIATSCGLSVSALEADLAGIPRVLVASR